MNAGTIQPDGAGLWEIVDLPEGVDSPVGPYDTRREAREARRRLALFLAHCDRPGFVTAGPRHRHRDQLAQQRTLPQ
jgi:hypothetical protein